MTKAQLHILQHALGVDQHGRGEMYRNHFCAGGDDVVTCRELIALGYMEQFATTDTLPYLNCTVTNAGKLAMLRESPTPRPLTRNQQRYHDYLRYSDAYPCTFREFLNISRTQEYKAARARAS